MEEGDYGGYTRHRPVSNDRSDNKSLNISARSRKMILVEPNASIVSPYMRSTHRSTRLLIYSWTAVGYSISLIRWLTSSTPCLKPNSSVICTNSLSVKAYWAKHAKSPFVMPVVDHLYTIGVFPGIDAKQRLVAEVISLIVLPVIETAGDMERR